MKEFADDKFIAAEMIIPVFDRKHCGKRRKCWLPAFSPFPTMFSKDFIYRVVKSRDCMVELNGVHIFALKNYFNIAGKGENA